VEKRPELLGTGAFGEASMLSVKALRLYAENGLLRPTWVDPSSGYRYYDPQLAPTGRLIAMLRDADVPLVDVRALVVASSEEASELLAVLKTRMRQHRSSADLLIDRVGGHLRSGAGEAVTDDGVTISWIDSAVVLSMWSPVCVDDLDAHGAAALASLSSAAAQAKVAVVGEAFAIFHGPVNRESDGPLEVGLPAAELVAAWDGVRTSRSHGGWFASTTARGTAAAYPAVLAAYDRVARWCEDQDWRIVGPPRETWIGLPWEPDPEIVVGWPVAQPAALTDEPQEETG